MLDLKTRVRVGLLVIIVLGLPLGILYKGPACSLGNSYILELDPKKSIEPRDVGAFANLSCILVANKIRVGESPVSPCVRENSEASRKAGLAGS